MKNPITFRVESSLGAVFISLLAFFFIGLIFIAVKNFETDIDVMTSISNSNRITHLSESERILIVEWAEYNDVTIPDGRGYRYLVRKYPDRPWLD
jgi:hypothetical protein